MSKTLGNVVNPFEMFDKYGADVLRWYLVAGSPIWKSKLFNEDDLKEIKNKFFDTLINTYKFFIICANLIGFKYDEKNIIPVKDRKEIDKWIISKLNSLKKDYSEMMNGYEITKPTRLLYDFAIDELSNWYVRRNRKRFRSPENEKDKLSAYQTLYECILSILQMLAPVSPFLSDKLYLELTGSSESIHLGNFDEYRESDINKTLEDQMEMAQQIVYLVRTVRVKNNLKVRQPLKQLLIPVFNQEQKETLLKVKDIILEEVNVKELKIIEGDSDIINKKSKPNFKSIGPKFGKDVKKVQAIINNLSKKEISEIELTGKIEKENFTLTNEDIEIYTENIEGWIVESDNNLTIALDTKLDEILVEEGIVREFINRIQNYRKTNDFNVNEKIVIDLKATDNIMNVVRKNVDYIKNEVFCDSIISSDKVDNEYFNTDINGEVCKFYIKKI